MRVIKIKKSASAPAKVSKPKGKRGPKEHYLDAEKDFLLSKLDGYRDAVKASTQSRFFASVAGELYDAFGETVFKDKVAAKNDEPPIDELPIGLEPDDDMLRGSLVRADADVLSARLSKLGTVSVYHEFTVQSPINCWA